jgi:hypothetical protein
MPELNAPLLFALKDGSLAEVVQSDGDKTTIRSPLPSPPGSTVRGTVTGLTGEFQLKVRSCKKEEGAFVIDGRAQNATRAIRAWLTRSAQKESAPSSSR